MISIELNNACRNNTGISRKEAGGRTSQSAGFGGAATRSNLGSASFSEI